MNLHMMQKCYPLPWKQETDGKRMTAIVAANGLVLAGSLIMRQPPERAAAERHAHAYIVHLVNQHPKPSKSR